MQVAVTFFNMRHSVIRRCLSSRHYSMQVTGNGQGFPLIEVKVKQVTVTYFRFTTLCHPNVFPPTRFGISRYDRSYTPDKIQSWTGTNNKTTSRVKLQSKDAMQLSSCMYTGTVGACWNRCPSVTFIHLIYQNSVHIFPKQCSYMQLCPFDPFQITCNFNQLCPPVSNHLEDHISYATEQPSLKLHIMHLQKPSHFKYK